MKSLVLGIVCVVLLSLIAQEGFAQCNVQSNASASSSAAIQQQAFLSALLSQQNRPAASAQSFAGSAPQIQQLNPALLSLFAQAQLQPQLRITPPAPVFVTPGASAQSFAGTANSNQFDLGQLANLLAAQNSLTQNVALGGCAGGSCGRSRSVARSSVRSLLPPLRRPTSISRSFSLQRT